MSKKTELLLHLCAPGVVYGWVSCFVGLTWSTIRLTWVVCFEALPVVAPLGSTL